MLSPPQALCTDTGAVDLTGLLLEKEIYPSNGGGYADVYRGVLQQDSSPCQVSSAVAGVFLIVQHILTAELMSGRNQSNPSHVYDEENQPKLDKVSRYVCTQQSSPVLIFALCSF